MLKIKRNIKVKIMNSAKKTILEHVQQLIIIYTTSIRQNELLISVSITFSIFVLRFYFLFTLKKKMVRSIFNYSCTLYV